MTETMETIPEQELKADSERLTCVMRSLLDCLILDVRMQAESQRRLPNPGSPDYAEGVAKHAEYLDRDTRACLTYKLKALSKELPNIHQNALWAMFADHLWDEWKKREGE